MTEPRERAEARMPLYAPVGCPKTRGKVSTKLASKKDRYKKGKGRIIEGRKYKGEDEGTKKKQNNKKRKKCLGRLARKRGKKEETTHTLSRPGEAAQS
jgi:hypothetical protein